jgi:hypothetical protein
MKISAHSILSLKVVHDYFQNGIWKGLSIEVAEHSRKTMAQNRLQLSSKRDGCCIVRSQHVYAGDTQPPQRLTPFSLRLHMQVADPHYFNYTALPITEIRRQTLYFTNRLPDGQWAEKVLSAEPYVSLGDCLPLFPAQFVWTTRQPEGIAVVVQDDLGIVHWETQTQADGSAEIDLRAADWGRYFIHVGGEPASAIVTAPQWGARPMAIIDLHFDPAMAAFQGKGETSLQLHFEARQIFWRYNVQLGKKTYAADAVVVQDVDHNLAFAPAELFVIDDEQQLRIISQDKVRLQERYPFSLELVQQTTNLVLAHRLPFPDFRNFKQHPAQQGEYLAESFVSL